MKSTIKRIPLPVYKPGMQWFERDKKETWKDIISLLNFFFSEEKHCLLHPQQYQKFLEWRNHPNNPSPDKIYHAIQYLSIVAAAIQQNNSTIRINVRILNDAKRHKHCSDRKKPESSTSNRKKVSPDKNEEPQKR